MPTIVTPLGQKTANSMNASAFFRAQAVEEYEPNGVAGAEIERI